VARKYFPRKKKAIGEWPAGQRPPREVAAQVKYVGSPEHKDYTSDAGLPSLRSDASRCDPNLPWAEIQQALKRGIEHECVSEQFEEGFPRFVWGWLEGRLYQARHIRGPAGTYKGWALEPFEQPDDPRDKLEWKRG